MKHFVLKNIFVPNLFQKNTFILKNLEQFFLSKQKVFIYGQKKNIVLGKKSGFLFLKNKQKIPIYGQKSRKCDFEKFVMHFFFLIYEVFLEKRQKKG